MKHESERRNKKNQKIRKRRIFCTNSPARFFDAFCIMICKYDKIWKWQWVGKSGLVYCFQSFENDFQTEEFYSFCLLRNPHSSIAPSFCLSPSLTLLFHPVWNFVIILSPPTFLPSLFPKELLNNNLEKLHSPELLNQSHLQTNRLCCAVAPWIIRSQQC